MSILKKLKEGENNDCKNGPFSVTSSIRCSTAWKRFSLHNFLIGTAYKIRTDLVKIIVCPPLHLSTGNYWSIERADDLEILVENSVFAPGNVNICEKEHAFWLEGALCTGTSSYGKGRYP